jgi:excisionase family DNA binding protein
MNNTELTVSAPASAHQQYEHECMTANELARYLRVNRKTVYEYAAQNIIPCRRLGRRLLFHRGAVTAWLARSSTGNPTPGRH